MGWNQPVVIQQRPSLGEQLAAAIPSFLTTMMIMKMGQKFRAKEAEINRQESEEATKLALQTKGYEKLPGPWPEGTQQPEVEYKGEAYAREPVELTPEQQRAFTVVNIPGKGPSILQKPLSFTQQLLLKTAGKQPTSPYVIASSNGIAIGILNKETGEIDKSGFEKQDVPTKDINVTTSTDKEGNVTWTAHHKISGEKLWSDSEKGIGRPGRVSEPATPQEKIQQMVEIATRKTLEVPGTLYKQAESAIDKGASLREQMNWEKDQTLRQQAIIKKMGSLGGVKTKYPNALFGMTPDGEYVYYVTEPDGRQRIVLDESGMH